MKYSSKILSQTLVQICLAKGIKHIVISPGSRNAPLTIGFTAISDFKCYSVVDERCAAFFGLGLAQQLKEPVALVCTSGSALLNYYPAIAEAFYSHIPLIVLSADRPSSLIDVGDGQTIRQENVYENHICYSANLKEGMEFQEFNEREICIALDIAEKEMGPVHVNVPFSEPLYEVVDEATVHPKPSLVFKEKAWEEDLSSYIDVWNKSKKKLVLLGAMDPFTLPEEQLDELLHDPSVLLFSETLSNVHHKKGIPAIDQLITSLSDEAFQKLQPDVLLTFGGMIVSKRIKAFLRKYQPKTHWHVGPYSANDTFFCLEKHFKTTGSGFLSSFLPNTVPMVSTYQEDWLTEHHHKLTKHGEFLATIPYSDFAVYNSIFRSIPSGYQLHLANSTAVRYSQLFQSSPDWEVYCNRGTSGIDGSTSTAVGAAVGSNKPTILVTGDLSFFYDSNALWNNYIPQSFRIILVNNGGGGIFRILPNAKNMNHFETYFETKHSLSAEPLCSLYGWNYAQAKTEEEVERSLQDFFAEGNRPKLLEVFTPSAINDVVLKDYFRALA